MAKEQYEVIGGEEVMSIKHLASYLNKSRAYVYKLLNNDNSFPSGFSLTPTGKRFWKRTDVEDWVKQKMNGAS